MNGFIFLQMTGTTFIHDRHGNLINGDFLEEVDPFLVGRHRFAMLGSNLLIHQTDPDSDFPFEFVDLYTLSLNDFNRAPVDPGIWCEINGKPQEFYHNTLLWNWEKGLKSHHRLRNMIISEVSNNFEIDTIDKVRIDLDGDLGEFTVSYYDGNRLVVTNCPPMSTLTTLFSFDLNNQSLVKSQSDESSSLCVVGNVIGKRVYAHSPHTHLMRTVLMSIDTLQTLMVLENMDVERFGRYFSYYDPICNPDCEI